MSWLKTSQLSKSFSDGKYTRAKSEFEYLILNDPLSKYAADSYFYIAESKYHLKQYSQAIFDYEKYLYFQKLYQPHHNWKKEKLNYVRKAW